MRRLLVLQIVAINAVFLAVGLNWLACRERALDLFLAAIAVQVSLIVPPREPYQEVPTATKRASIQYSSASTTV